MANDRFSSFCSWHFVCNEVLVAVEFFISFTFKTSNGTETFAKFAIGNDRDEAYRIFKKLKGSDKVDEKNVLSLDFFEIEKGLPKNLKVLSCTLPQLQENCGIITKELFRHHNFDDSF
jgi:hypothetical protein